jgi:hypothetical protein
MNDFLNEVFTSARRTADSLLNKLEKYLDDTNTSDELEQLQLDVDRLEAVNDSLQDENSDLLALVKVLLDGKKRKNITLTWKKYYELQESDLEFAYLDPGGTDVTIEIRQSS